MRKLYYVTGLLVALALIARLLLPGVLERSMNQVLSHAPYPVSPKAQALHDKYAQLFDDLFIDTNPIPVKAAMAMMGMIEEIYRLPMCSTTDENKAVLRASLVNAGVL